MFMTLIFWKSINVLMDEEYLTKKAEGVRPAFTKEDMHPRK